MDYNDQEYLNLFKQIKNDNFGGQMIKETPDYNDYNNSPMIKETPDYSGYEQFRNQNLNEIRRQSYTQDYNLNEFNIETRINGENINEIKRQSKEERLNEVMQKMRMERMNEVKSTQENENLNETVNFKDANVITVEMFEKARYNSMMQVARRILPK